MPPNFRASVYKTRKVHVTIRTNVLSSQRAAIVVREKRYMITRRKYSKIVHVEKKKENVWPRSYARTLRWPFAYTLLARSELLSRGVCMAAKLF